VKEEKIGEIIPNDPYGFSKFIMNQYGRKMDKIYNLRLFGVFGKYENWKRRFISNICIRALLGYPLAIKQNAVFDYLYIDDLIEIVQWFIKNNPRYKDYNVCSGKPIQLFEVTKIILKVLNKNLPVKLEKEGFQNEYTADNSRLTEEIATIKFTEYSAAIEKLCTWYSNQKYILDTFRRITND
jgi:GDP-L-fucose synthase